MTFLSYRTRDGSDPQGKPRVYFCSYRQTLSSCFDDICQDIFTTQNCAIWYNTGDERDDTFWDDLRNMQLFVLPVTRALLTENHAAMEEFRFAIANHIPVLPLLQEQELDGLFSQVCGDLQYLDKHNKDSTAISYDEKLRQYLSGVLLGDKLAEDIRNAFDAYIFLSYRKKDRILAQKLMKQIHQNDFCRDVAIWYDEFLTPGEDFNEAIQQALHKSKLFLLTVTPNLVNENNYIMTTEYPMARSAKKPILPVQMAKTSRWKLFRHFKGLGRLADTRNNAELSRLLKQKLQGLSLRQKDSAAHDYLMGLAYLGGVDVEVDHQKAVALITGAADAGLPAAIDKLIQMYRTGLGVKRSYETAALWQEKGIIAEETAYRDAPSVNTLNTLFWRGMHCGDAYRELLQPDKAIEKYKQALRFMQQADPQISGQLCRNFAAAYDKLGGCCMAQGQLIKARQYAAEGLRFSIALMLEDDNTQTRRDASVSYEKLGNICLAEGNPSEAAKHYEQSHKLRLQCMESEPTEEAQRDLFVSCARLGDLFLAERNPAYARRYYEQGLQLARKLYQSSNTPEAKRDLSVSLDQVGDVCFAMGDFSAARQYYQESLSLTKDLAEETEAPDTKRDLSVSHQKLGDLCQAEGDLIQARQHFQDSLWYAQRYGTETMEARRNLSACYERLGDLCLAENDPANARQYYEQCLELREAGNTVTPEARQDLALALEKMGDCQLAEGRLSAARYYYERALTLAKAGATDTAADKWDIAAYSSKLGDVCLEEDDLSGAKRHYTECLQLREALVQESDTPEHWEGIAVACMKMAMVEDNPRSCLVRALSILDILCQHNPDNDRYRHNRSLILTALEEQE